MGGELEYVLSLLKTGSGFSQGVWNSHLFFIDYFVSISCCRLIVYDSTVVTFYCNGY